MTDDPVQAAYEAGERDGYQRGELERIALATANSELRSELLALQQQLDAYAGAGR